MIEDNMEKFRKILMHTLSTLMILSSFGTVICGMLGFFCAAFVFCGILGIVTIVLFLGSLFPSIGHFIFDWHYPGGIVRKGSTQYSKCIYCDSDIELKDDSSSGCWQESKNS